ncbi:ABC transporter ATP-binding protein [Alicyclobacillaceae bacterium I2511]|nr:ABC transporter ATP-binding protein [Alicyclobacillaceae bacterium I2511]
MAYLQLDNLTKKFGNHMVIDHVSLNIDQGELVSIVGPSGGGKTTILRMIAGLISPDEGHIIMDGSDITQVPTHRRNIGVVFQSYALFPHLTAWKNIAYPLELRHYSKEAIQKRVDELVDLIKISGPNRYPAQLSGGEQQRVAIARALASNPKIILLDEPLAALDAKVRVIMRSEFARLYKTLGVTMILVTHDQEDALSLATRVAILSPEGILEQIGTPEEVYNHPSTPFVATFIGTTNVFNLETYDATTHHCRWAGYELQCSTTHLHQDTSGKWYFYVRPEYVVMQESDVGMEAQVLRKTFLGSIVRLTLSIKGAEVLMDTPAAQAMELELGDLVKVSLKGISVLSAP